jgi:hypothetical protein
MARSVDEIYNELLPKVKNALGIDENTIVSAVSIEGMLTYAFAFAANLVEQVFDKVKAEIQSYVDNMKPHSRLWYSNMVKDFQYGYEVDEETLNYDNSGLTEEEIAASKIVESVSIVDGDNNLQVKVARKDGDDLGAFSSDQLNALESYIGIKKDAGVKINLTSNEADQLKMSADIYVDPLLFNSDGTLIVTGETPVHDAIKKHLKNLPFNGVYSVVGHIDEIQAVDGVVFPGKVAIEHKYGDLGFTSISDFVIPDAGYLRFENENDLQLTFKFRSPS